MSEKEVIVIELAPAREWTIFDQRRLERLRSEARLGNKLFFVPHLEHPALSIFRMGTPYQIDVLQHTDICQTQIGDKIYAFNCHVLLSHFSPIFNPGGQYPFLSELSMADIYVSADRWLALGKLPYIEIEQSDGYADEYNTAAPAYRQLTLNLGTAGEPEDNDEHARAIRLSKLTELADLMRAIEVENRIEAQTNAHPTTP